MAHLPHPVSADRILALTGSVDEERCAQLADSILSLNQASDAPVLLVLDSLGGIGEAARSLAVHIRLSPAPVFGLVCTRAYSAAAVVLQACHLRLALTTSSIGLHFSYVSGPQMIYSAEMADSFAVLTERGADARNAIWKAEAQVLAARTGHDFETAWNLLKEGATLSAQEALDLRLLDSIVRGTCTPSEIDP